MKFKVADRIVVVTTSAIIKLDNKYKVMKTIPLDKVSYSEEPCDYDFNRCFISLRECSE